jgi:hypothetical protein
MSKGRDVHLMIGTPAYGGMMHSDYVNELLRYQRLGLRFGLTSIGNESLITRARNTIVAEFLVRPEFTHLLFLDADVLLPAEGLRRLIAYDRDVIGAPVPLKGHRADGSRIFNIGQACGEDGPLWLCERIGTAVLMLSRRAIEALVDDARSDGRIYSRGFTGRGDTRATLHYDIFRVGVSGEEYLSEDYWVCDALRRLGFSIHVDPTVVTQHSGVMKA